MRAKSPECESSRRSATKKRGLSHGCNPLLRNILPAIPSLSIFYLTTLISILPNLNKAWILPNPSEKKFNPIFKAIHPVATIASL